ncbi:hypothetical protein F5Y14DRAFT_169176 [Nemania sp. NC0429]|nr:hypothetical protein F5Y14DRAFT_169176 [Nemania sp. NC0429]
MARRESGNNYFSGLPEDLQWNPWREGDEQQPEIIDLDSDSSVQEQPEFDEISCKNDVLLIFPEMCPEHLTQLAVQHNYISGAIISAILDKQEKGENYPTRAGPTPLSRKRKRELGQDLDYNSDGGGEGDEHDLESVRSIKLKMAAHDYGINKTSPQYGTLARILISQDFPRVPQNMIRSLLLGNNKSVFETYTAIDDKLRNRDEVDVPWRDKKAPTKTRAEFAPDRFSSLDMSAYTPAERAAFAEFVAARELSAAKDAKAAAEAEERANFRRAQDQGQTTDCGICFEECPLNRMVGCEGETVHWFCRSCLKSQAESQIGMAKHEITCMSLDGCSAGFSWAQRALFLNKKLTVALDRIEQEAVLRMAGIENLETCPFCPYAAEYPPVEVDKEFRCDNPSCRQVSCRLCRKESHIPKTCAEADADRGLDVRHILEEAMSEALIRKCNKCGLKFVKQDGCNKIKCNKCGTIQCDVCRQTIHDYSHFNDTNRGGKVGQCPLFDESQGRYEAEVSNAEAQMRKKVVEENPDVDEEALRIPISKTIPRCENKPKEGGFIAHQPIPRPQPRPQPVQPGEVVDRFGVQVQPNNLLFQRRHLPPRRWNNGINPAFEMIRADYPIPLQRPNGKMDNIVRAAEDVVQKAMKRMELPVPFRVGGGGGVGSPNAIEVPAPILQSFKAFINKK